MKNAIRHLFHAALLGLAVFSAKAETNFTFPVGESLTYHIYWGPLHVAVSRVTTEWIEEEGRPRIAIRVTTKSTSLLDKLYPVNDFIESIVEPEAFLPVRFTRKLSEGRYRLHEVTAFDRENDMAHWRHLQKNNSQDFEIEADTRDILSFMYFMRSRKLAPHSRYEYQVMADEKLYDLALVTQDVEPIDVHGYSPVRSLKMEPVAAFQGLFVRVGRLWVWVSEDRRALFTKGIARTPFGRVRVNLVKVEGPGDDFWAKPDNKEEHEREK
ncbi:MAG: DUF3108 domain-containing protein [Lentisphaerae bacterium]|nr:DUF3108 domain-containing protein [Lentisphaerota bacterium]